MIAGLDSSFDAPSLAQAQAAYAAGVRVWGGYLGSQGGLGLAVRWSRMAFWNLQQAGIQPIGFCSGWDDPDWIRTTAAEWGILACVDVEYGIRDDGPWLPGFLQRAQCGLYGAMSVHYETGEDPGRGALFNILAWYPGRDPRATWYDAIELRPPAPCGWQWQGTHQELGLGVDSLWLDDLILPSGPGRGGTTSTPSSASEGTMISLPHPTEAGRRDLLVIDSKCHLAHAVHRGGAGALNHDLAWEGWGLLPTGELAPGTLCAYWDELARIVVMAADAAGQTYLKVVQNDGTVDEDWSAIPIVVTPPAGQGPKGDPGEVDVAKLTNIVLAEGSRRMSAIPPGA